MDMRLSLRTAGLPLRVVGPCRVVACRCVASFVEHRHIQHTSSTMNLYPDIVHEGDLSPDAVGAEIEEACKEIHEACKGFGTDEKRLVSTSIVLPRE